MNLIQALQMLAGDTSQVAVRPEGEILHMTRNCAIKNLSASTPRAYILTYGAAVANNWQVIPIEKLRAASAEANGQGG